jgi:hypothetical protein
LNSWLKFRAADNYNNFNSMSTAQQIFTLSNDAHWRNSAAYAASFETDIDLDYRLVITDPEQFRSQLLTLTSKHTHWRPEWTQQLTPELVAHAAGEFGRTAIDPAQHISNVQSIGWQGWCHALALAHGVNIPVDIVTDLPGYQAWLTEQDSLFVELTLPFVL